MIERYKHEFNWWQRVIATLTTMWRINKDSIDFKWGYFAPRFGLELQFHRGGYFDARCAISFCFVWGMFLIKLPFKTKLGEGCSMPKYGFYYAHRQLCFCWGGKYDVEWVQVTMPRSYHWDIPFISYVFEYHKMQIDGEWVDYDFDLHHNVSKGTKSFNYFHGQEMIPVTVTWSMDKRQWHRKYLPWIKMTHIHYEFESNEELGPSRGIFKGGTIGFSRTVTGNETALQALENWLKENNIDYELI